IIARRVGRQITNLNPLLDAHLVTGDRANATLFPISSAGNTLTIRRFRREPWTITDFIANKTITPEISALVWLAMQSELNILVSGGTGSGKTSFLNVCMPFIQPNQRIVSIEDTRELQLPEFLHWVPLVTREPNPEGKGGVKMIELMVNSLRMRPDRILVGEIRRSAESEVLFEAMHTGHSVYSTFHANTSDQTIRRLTNEPIDIAPGLLEAVHLNIVMFRNRRTGSRRVFQVSEFVPARGSFEDGVAPNVLYRWKAVNDTISKHADSIRLLDELTLHTAMTRRELDADLKTKEGILKWLVKNKVSKIGDVGRIMATYYSDPDFIVKNVAKGAKPSFILKE
ncbi:MAG: CpaF family protein, partial [Candidatus Diapherotrites archaeon]|nr:CpaF family protein [Candidatus Diapherotrites archaeon]